MRVWCEVRFAGCGCSSREVEEKPVTGLFVQPYEHAAMAGEQDRAALDRRPGAAAVLEAETDLTDLPLLHFPPFVFDFTVARCRVCID